MTIAELLTSQRRWGRTRARKFLLPLSLSENKQLGRSPRASAACSPTELAAPLAGGRARPHRLGAPVAAHPTDPEAEASGGALEGAARE